MDEKYRFFEICAFFRIGIKRLEARENKKDDD